MLNAKLIIGRVMGNGPHPTIASTVTLLTSGREECAFSLGVLRAGETLAKKKYTRAGPIQVTEVSTHTDFCVESTCCRNS
jgi:hypothetical protein